MVGKQWLVNNGWETMYFYKNNILIKNYIIAGSS